MNSSYRKLLCLSIFIGACLLTILWMVMPIHSLKNNAGTSASSTQKPLPTPIVSGAAMTEKEPEAASPAAIVDDNQPQTQPTVTYKNNFSDAAFIGDSMLEVLSYYGGLSKIDFFTEQGLMVNDASDYLTKIKKSSYARVYIQFGINELGWPDVNDFVSQYKDFLLKVQKVQPSSKIFVMSIFPVSAGKTSNIIDNDHVNLFNKAIKSMVKKLGDPFVYLNVSQAVADSTGALPEGTSDDGIHLNRECTNKWIDYMREHLS